MYVAVGALEPATETAIEKYLDGHCFSPEFDYCINKGAADPACRKYKFINDAFEQDEQATEAIFDRRWDSPRSFYCDYSKGDVAIYGGIAVAGAALVGFLLGLRMG